MVALFQLWFFWGATSLDCPLSLSVVRSAHQALPPARPTHPLGARTSWGTARRSARTEADGDDTAEAKSGSGIVLDPGGGTQQGRPLMGRRRWGNAASGVAMPGRTDRWSSRVAGRIDGWAVAGSARRGWSRDDSGSARGGDDAARGLEPCRGGGARCGARRALHVGSATVGEGVAHVYGAA